MDNTESLKYEKYYKETCSPHNMKERDGIYANALTKELWNGLR